MFTFYCAVVFVFSWIFNGYSLFRTAYLTKKIIRYLKEIEIRDNTSYFVNNKNNKFDDSSSKSYRYGIDIYFSFGASKMLKDKFLSDENIIHDIKDKKFIELLNKISRLNSRSIRIGIIGFISIILIFVKEWVFNVISNDIY